MKQFLRGTAFILLCMMIVSIAAAESLNIDLTKLSDQALQELYASVGQELDSRGLSRLSSYTLPEGKYIVGQDIMPGRYTLTCSDTSGEKLGNAYSSLGGLFGSLGGEDSKNYGNLMGSLGGLMSDLVETQVKIIGDYGTVLKSYELEKGQSIQIVLEEKTAIQIEDGTCTLTPVN